MRVFATAVGIFFSIALLMALFLPYVGRSAREPARRTQCLNNLHNLVIALHNYQSQYGSLPPACIKDAEGRPMHSWRALLLPYLDRQDIAEVYRFDEPWDGPNNRKLHEIKLDVFHCPEEGGRMTDTSYFAVTGPETIWGDDVPLDWNESNSWDGLSQTIMLVEMSNAGVHWLEPRDLPLSEIAPTINTKEGRGISSRHPGVAVVAFADGRVRPIADNLPPAIVRALLTVQGGEPVSDEDF